MFCWRSRFPIEQFPRFNNSIVELRGAAGWHSAHTWKKEPVFFIKKIHNELQLYAHTNQTLGTTPQQLHENSNGPLPKYTLPHSANKPRTATHNPRLTSMAPDSTRKYPSPNYGSIPFRLAIFREPSPNLKTHASASHPIATDSTQPSSSQISKDPKQY